MVDDLVKILERLGEYLEGFWQDGCQQLLDSLREYLAPYLDCLLEDRCDPSLVQRHCAKLNRF